MTRINKLRDQLRRRVEKAAKRRENAAFIRKMSGRKKLPSIKSLKNKLWDLNTEIVKRRDGPLCKTCPVAFPGQPVQEGYAQCHIIPASEGQAAKYDLFNLYWGCAKCNKYESEFRARWATSIFPQAFGNERVRALWDAARETVQYKRGDLMAMIAEREQMLGISPQGDK